MPRFQQQDQNQRACDNDSLLSSPIETPILRCDAADITYQEEVLVDKIDRLISRFLLRPDHRSPYSFSFQWTSIDEPSLCYNVKLTIHEPARF